MLNKRRKKVVEKATVDQSFRFKAELEISLFTLMKMNKSDCSCLCFTNIENKSDIIYQSCQALRVRLRLTSGT